jgi:hypothetical protein
LRPAILACIGMTAGAVGLPAQEPCPRVATIAIQTGRVFDDSAGAVMSKLYDAGNWLHVETSEEFIRGELLFGEGDCFDGFLLGESERLLRQFDFLQSASIESTRREDGDVDVRVVTRDDWSLRLEPRLEFSGVPTFTGVGLAERNIVGSGRGLELVYVDRAGRDQVGGQYSDPQLLGTRWDLNLAAGRTEPGWLVEEGVSYPFLGLVGRWAAFQHARYGEGWFRYVVGDHEKRVILVQPYTRRAIQLGAARRMIQQPTYNGAKLGAYGASLSYERLSYATSFVYDSLRARDLGISENGAALDLAQTLEQRDNLRLNLMVGVQSLRFLKRRGLATLRSTEDVPLGASAEFVLGLASSALGSSDSHVLAALDLFGSLRVTDDLFSLVNADIEARRDFGDRYWHDIFAVVQWTNLWQPNHRRTVVLTGHYSAGWDATIPFQLTLGGETGLAGLASYRYPGGARAVVRLEDRYLVARVGRLFDLGTVAFVDVGEMWANDVPFGVDSGLLASFGGGLRLATPSGSRLAYRLQVAAPLQRHLGFDELVFSVGIERRFETEIGTLDDDLARSRDVGLNTLSRHLR